MKQPDFNEKQWKIIEDALGAAMCLTLSGQPTRLCDFSNEEYESVHEVVYEFLEEMRRRCPNCGEQMVDGPPGSNDLWCPRHP